MEDYARWQSTWTDNAVTGQVAPARAISHQANAQRSVLPREPTHGGNIHRAEKAAV
jgi:hypothetical protein